MLEQSHEKNLIDDLWDVATAKVQLPEQLSRDFHTFRGPLPTAGENQRSYHRFYMRGKALLKRGSSMLAGYTKDVSRAGVGFLSPVQLLPKERIKMHLPTAELHLEVARCRRVDDACFECGARFALTNN